MSSSHFMCFFVKRPSFVQLPCLVRSSLALYSWKGINYLIISCLIISGLQKPENKCSPNLVASDLSDDLVDATLSEAVKADLQTWKHHDESKNDFCDIHSETCDGCDYIDLTINPERFTGYSGEASRRVWRAIYEENCFKPSKSGGSLFLQDSLEDMCLEKRAFYRAVSGLHSR